MTDRARLRQIVAEQDATRPDAKCCDPLEACGLTALSVGCDLGDVAVCLKRLPGLLNGANQLERMVVRNRAIQELERCRVRAAAGLVDAALGGGISRADRTGHALTFDDPEPWSEEVDGTSLLDDLSAWLRRYLFVSPEAADAVTLWVVLTFLVDAVLYAPILAVLSATRRCGKTVLLDLLRPVVRRGYFTSAGGITPAVLFRLNERDRPTLLIDEGERLAGRDADRDLVGMLNVGYRRGARVPRCTERGGDYEIRDFDAFGFRAVAAIGDLWDTLTDRAIVVRLTRAPRDADVARFVDAQVTEDGAIFARQIRRWVTDVRDPLVDAYTEAPRPHWLDARACDNWLGLFAVARVAGGDWPSRAESAARGLRSRAEDEQDHGERLIHAMQLIFSAAGWPEVMKSGDVVRELNAMESEPWGEYRRGDGITAHRVAALLRRFEVRPASLRNAAGDQVRGWWLADLRPVFSRYPAGDRFDRFTVAEGTHSDGSETDATVETVSGESDAAASPWGARGAAERLDPDEEARQAMRDGA